MNNTEIWDKFKHPAPGALREIKGGRLSGKSDINPQWRYQAMTEYFGPCGIGWKYEVTKKWTEAGPAGQVFAFVDVNLYIKVSGEWSEPIPGNGGDFLIEQEKGGLHPNDEAFKMATTDALGAAMKMIGMAAEVYLGNYEGSKYKRKEGQAQGNEKKNPPAGDGKQGDQTTGKPGNGQGTQGDMYISDQQKKAIEAIIGNNKLSRDMVKEFLYSKGFMETDAEGRPTMAKLQRKVAGEILEKTDAFLKSFAKWAAAKAEGRA